MVGTVTSVIITMMYLKIKLSPNIVRVIKCRKLRWAGHVTRIEDGRRVFKILTGKTTRDL